MTTTIPALPTSADQQQPVHEMAPVALAEHIRVLMVNAGPAAVSPTLRLILVAAANALSQYGEVAEPVYFYRRGQEKRWHQTSAEHLETIKGLSGETYECKTFYTRRHGIASVAASHDASDDGGPAYFGVNFCPNCGERSPEGLHQYDGYTYCKTCDPD